jgi:hypothetical protein
LETLFYNAFYLRYALVLRLSIALLLALCACSARAEVTVLTSLKPLQLIAAAVQEGVGQPDVLLPPGASPHQYALRPSDVRRIRDATLVYWIGSGLETFCRSCSTAARARACRCSHCRACICVISRMTMASSMPATNMTTTTIPVCSMRICGWRRRMRG